MKLPLPHTLQSIAQHLEREYSGPDDLPVTGVNEIHKVETGDVTFTDIPKYYQKALKSAASVVLINSEDLEVPDEKGLIFSPDPFSDYQRLVREFGFFTTFPGRGTIAPDAEVADDAAIAPGAVIGSGVKIGSGTIINPNVVIYGRCTIGRYVIIHANTTIGSDAFYYKSRGDWREKMLSAGQVTIEDEVEIGANCSIDKGVSGETRIGHGTKLDNQVHIGHGVVLGRNCLLAAGIAIAGKTVIEDEVIIWGQAGIDKNLHIGKGAVILAKAGVLKDVPAGQTVFGFPARESRQALQEMAALRRLAREQGK